MILTQGCCGKGKSWQQDLSVCTIRNRGSRHSKVHGRLSGAEDILSIAIGCVNDTVHENV